MKLTTFLIFLFIGCAIAGQTYSQTKLLNLNIDKTTVKEVLSKIEEQSEFYFMYSGKFIDVNREVSINVKNQKIEEILDLLFAGTNVDYTIKDKFVVLTPSELVKKGISVTSQQKSVTGVVTNSDGQPLPGVTVVIKGTTQGTITNSDGEYSLTNIPANATLQFSFVGMKTFEASVVNRSRIDVSMESETVGMEEVIVIGYGTQKKSRVLGAVAQISSKDLQTSPTMNLSSMLQGKLSGVISKQSSGQPGYDGASLAIRGLSTLGDNSPLVVVDGIPRPFPSINPDEIESLTVLKDASSAAVYGVRASNGVILITTKKGIEHKPEISINSAVSVSSNTNFPEFLNGSQYAYWYDKAQELDGVSEAGRLFSREQMDRIQNGDPLGVFGNTDWFGLLFKDYAPSYTNNISLRGGSKSVKYFMSVSSYNQEGIIDRTSYDRYNLRANIDAQVTDNFEIGFRLGALTSDTKESGLSAGMGNSYASIFSQAIMSYPYLAPYTAEGKPVGSMNPGNGNQNPLTARDLSGSKTTNSNKLEGSISMKYSMPAIKGLDFRVNAAYDKGYSMTKSILLPYMLMIYNLSNDTYNEGYARHSLSGDAYVNQWFADSWTTTIQSSVNYYRDFNKHSVSGLFLYEYIGEKGTGLSTGKKGFPIRDIMDINYGEEVIDAMIKGGHNSFERAGYISRLSYSFDEKYMFEFTGRLDGSPNFSKENRWGFFPAVTVGWRISKETFWQENFSFFDDLKLKASVGKLGNDAIGRYAFMRTMSLGNDPVALIGDKLSRPLQVDRVPNKDITWEETTSYNIGLESTFLGGKLEFDIDAFYMVTSDILQSQSGLKPPSLGGYFPATINSGIVDNRGIELDIHHNNRIGKFQYSIKGNVSWARNKVIKTTENPSVPEYQLQTGKPIGQKYGFISDGLFQTEEEIQNSALYGPTLQGDVKLVDLNGDGRITFEQDWTVIGRSNQPELMFGLNMNGAYQNFDFSMFIQGAALNDVALAGYYSDRGFHDNTFYSKPFWSDGNSPLYLVEEAWRPDNTNAKYPRLGIESRQNGGKFSDWWVTNGAYARLKTVQLGYTLPKFQNSDLKARVYISGSNLFTLDYLKYFDPEMPDVNQGYYPQQKVYELGIRMTF
uniref:TonB-dependent receptor n=1 Tax=uncultured Draconibacterium sp. TaxID=1573823 RepID=UPI0032169532